MDNDQIVDSLELLVKLWDLHGVNEFKSKNLAFAARGLDKFPGLISTLPEAELLAIPGVGKVVVQLVKDVASSGTCSDLEQIIEQTPPGLLTLLKIKGLGPKKVRTIWQELQITEIDDLLSGLELRKEGTPNKYWPRSSNDKPVDYNSYKLHNLFLLYFHEKVT